MRRLIFCFDGSWNSLDTKSDPTNVVLVAESILPVDKEGIQQIVYYDEGVGTASDETWRGGIFGKGLVANIRDAYRFLIFNFQPGDQIFVFGFSRGAFTARSFIGFVRLAGILKVNDANQIRDAWQLYMKYASQAGEDNDEVLRFRSAYCPQLCISTAEYDWRQRSGLLVTKDIPVLVIQYCGVWDTVGTLGWKAVTALFDRRTDKRYVKHDTDLSATVEAGRHAVAIDERRVHFMPTLWRNVRALNAAADFPHDDGNAPFQQKWFAGDHGSVGGGGAERGLSNAALHWVLKGAIDKGLEVDLTGRSQLKTIRYNARAPLQNTSAKGLHSGSPVIGVPKAALGWIKAMILAAPRSGPDEICDVHVSTLRRWFTPVNNLPEKKAYRPEPLQKLAAKIDEQAEKFQPVEAGTLFREYIVQPNDFLSRIAERELGSVHRTEELFALNRDMLDDKDDIFPGDRLRLPIVT